MPNIEAFAEKFRPRNPYASAMHKTLADFGVTDIPQHEYQQANLLVSGISYHAQVRFLASRESFDDSCTVFIQEIRQPHEGEFWFQVEQSLDGISSCFSSAWIAEIWDGTPPQRFLNPSIHLSQVGLGAFFRKLASSMALRIAQMTGTTIPTLEDFVAMLLPIGHERYTRLRHMMHILHYLAMDDGFLFESERKVIRNLMQKHLDRDPRNLYLFSRYIDHAYVTVPAFKRSMRALLPMSREQAQQLIDECKALIASDGVFSDAEEIFLREIYDLVQNAAA